MGFPLVRNSVQESPSRKFLKIRCQKSEFGGISASKVDFNITFMEYKGTIVAMQNKSGHTALSQTTS